MYSGEESDTESLSAQHLPNITISRGDPELFALVHTFMHTGSLPLTSEGYRDIGLPAYTCNQLLSLWVFADQHDIPVFQNYLLDLVYEKLIFGNRLPRLPEIELVFEQSFPGQSLMRQLLCTLAIELWQGSNTWGQAHDIPLGVDLTSMLLQDVLEGRPGASSTSPWDRPAQYIGKLFGMVENHVLRCPHGLDNDGNCDCEYRPLLAGLLSDSFFERAKKCEWHIHEEGVSCPRKCASQFSLW
jgi:hypothetical protein